MSRIAMSLAAAMVSFVATLAIPAGAAIVSGQSDNFEDGSLQSWQTGARDPDGPTNMASGGPGGLNDNFLRLTSNGAFGAGGKLVVFNPSQWAGDYLGAAVTSIRMQVDNLGATPLVLRLILVDSAAGQSLTTVSPVNVAAGSGWETVSFSLASANLAGGVFNTVMGHVTELDLVHSPSVIGARSSALNIAAVLGVDNVAAVPEPSPLVLTVLGFALAMCSAARRLRREV